MSSHLSLLARSMTVVMDIWSHWSEVEKVYQTSRLISESVPLQPDHGMSTPKGCCRPQTFVCKQLWYPAATSCRLTVLVAGPQMPQHHTLSSEQRFHDEAGRRPSTPYDR